MPSGQIRRSKRPPNVQGAVYALWEQRQYAEGPLPTTELREDGQRHAFDVAADLALHQAIAEFPPEGHRRVPRDHLRALAERAMRAQQ